jgi:hypothetical protein
LACEKISGFLLFENSFIKRINCQSRIHKPRRLTFILPQCKTLSFQIRHFPRKPWFNFRPKNKENPNIGRAQILAERANSNEWARVRGASCLRPEYLSIICARMLVAVVPTGADFIISGRLFAVAAAMNGQMVDGKRGSLLSAGGRASRLIAANGPRRRRAGARGGGLSTTATYRRERMTRRRRIAGQPLPCCPLSPTKNGH